MHDLTLKRVEIGEAGAFGVLQWMGETFAVTIERTYTGARGAQEVKIPAGVYKCVRSRFNKAKQPYDTWKIVGGVVTPDREIKFHIGNWEADFEGCVGIGESFALLKGHQAIADSAKGFKEFMARTSGRDEIALAVINT